MNQKKDWDFTVYQCFAYARLINIIMDDTQSVPNPQGEGMPTPPVEEKKPEGEVPEAPVAPEIPVE